MWTIAKNVVKSVPTYYVVMAVCMSKFILIYGLGEKVKQDYYSKYLRCS